VLISIIPAPASQVRDKLQQESSNFKGFRMPPEQSPGQAYQVGHDGFGTFCEFINFGILYGINIATKKQ